MRQYREYIPVALTFAGLFIFELSVTWPPELTPEAKVILDAPVAVVIPAVAQVVLYGGDRFLAANIEQVRAAMSGGVLRTEEAVFRVRAHIAVSRLNPCHGDNYWIGNAELTWGGSHEDGTEILRRAMECRYWDEWPAFFYGFNQHFFNRNVDESRRALELAARRADEKNAAAYRNFSIMLLAGELEDAKLALELVQRERDNTTDGRLRKLLEQRAQRLEGLVQLRQAQENFERMFSRLLRSPQELIDFGLLTGFPTDPLRLGYEFKNGEFHLRRLRHEGLESLR